MTFRKATTTLGWRPRGPMADAVKLIAGQVDRGELNDAPLARGSLRQLEFQRDRHTVALA